MEFLAVLFVVALYGLLIFGVVSLVRRASRNRRTREMVQTFESNFEELKRRVESLSLRTSRLDEDNRRFRESIQRLEAALLDSEPTFETPPIVGKPAATVPVELPLPPVPLVGAVSNDASVLTAAAEPAAMAGELAPCLAGVSAQRAVVVHTDIPAVAIEKPRPNVLERREEPSAVTAPERRTGEEWEALVGGNWLNKAGVVVFVIGLSLFLGYSLTRFGPAGRVAIGWAVNIALLGGGVVLERRPRYALFAHGLAAGGWAGCYFTAFAMYALPAARVLENPFVGTVMLVAVAAAMIAHSLAYRSETVTALTYFIGFATLNVAPLSSFTLFASAPLVMSLLAVAYRFQWGPMGVMGVVLTYGSFLVRMATSTEPAAVSQLATAQAILALYWVMFEIFDLLDVRRQRETDVLRTLFPLNAAGLIGTSMLLWGDQPAASLYLLYALTAAAYLVSSIARAKLRPQETFDQDDSLSRAWAGGYEGAITVAAAFAAVAIGLRFSGIRLAGALMLEGELLLLSGLRLNTRYLRGLASIALTAAFVMLIPLFVGPSEGSFVMLGPTWDSWLPIAMLMAAAFYLDRALLRQKTFVFAEPLFASLGTLLVVLLVGHVTPLRFLGLAWLALSLALVEASIRLNVTELRRHAYGVMMIALAAFLVVISRGTPDAAWWQTLTASAAMSYVVAARVSGQAGGVSKEERLLSRQSASWAATALAATAIFYAPGQQYAGLAWLVLAWPLLELGLGIWPECRAQAAVVGTIATSRILAMTEFGFLSPSPFQQLLVLAAGGSLAAAAAIRLFAFGDVERPEQASFRDPCALLSIVFLSLLAWHALPDPIVALAWGGFALVLVETGAGIGWPFLANCGHALAVVTFGRLFLANFVAGGEVFGISTRLLTVAPCVPLFYYLGQRVDSRQSTAIRSRRSALARMYVWIAPVVVAALLRFELGRVFAPGGWAVFALLILVLAVKRRDVDYRLQSYLLSAAAFVRGWTTNFEAPEAFGGLPIEVGIAGVVIASLYAAEFVLPRIWLEHPSTADGMQKDESLLNWVDSHARQIFSILATALLAAMLFHNVPSGFLTVAWALQGLVLLAAGFPGREPILRRSGLVLLGVCLVKVLAYDSRELETLARIMSFTLLGAVLIVVSWIYTRFASRLRRYL